MHRIEITDSRANPGNPPIREVTTGALDCRHAVQKIAAELTTMSAEVTWTDDEHAEIIYSDGTILAATLERLA